MSRITPRKLASCLGVDGAPQYQSAAGNIYANEGNHWDITYF